MTHCFTRSFSKLFFSRQNLPSRYGSAIPTAQSRPEREAYRHAMLRLIELAYLVIDPPGTGSSSLPASPVRIDSCEPDPTLPVTRTAPSPGFAGRFFVSEWNSFIHFSARDVSLEWTAA
jgi:hypothetical protein